MAFNISSATSDAIESLRKALFGVPIAYKIKSAPQNKSGVVTGELVGGNLSVLYSIIGSQSEVNLDGKVLYIEDLDEYLYHLDRMLMNLKRNRYFEKIKALIVGGMTNMKDNEIPWGKCAEEIIEDITKDYQFPILYHFPAGHIKDNRTLIMGRKVRVTVNSQEATVCFQE
jgi:muramoyltetrapeptide carboxypeptidase